MPRTRQLTQAQIARKYGFRSGLEGAVGADLTTKGVPFLYEEVKAPFVQPAKRRTYTPDFLLANGIVPETKGRFLTADRQKHLWVKEQHPMLDLRFVFSNSRQRISAQSRTTYAKWCESKGFLYADRLIPDAWLRESPNRESQEAIIEIVRGTGDEEKLEKILKLFGML